MPLMEVDSRRILPDHLGRGWHARRLRRHPARAAPSWRALLPSQNRRWKRYFDVLVNTFVVRVLPPWSENIGKRIVKTPKIYVADTGLLHALLDIPTVQALARFPREAAA
jgi:uncharacterized protein